MAFALRGLDPAVLERIDATAEAKGMSRNAYIVTVLTDHTRRVRPVASPHAFRQAVELASDLGDRELMASAWS